MVDEKLILGLLLMRPDLLQGLDLDVVFFREKRQRLIFREIANSNGEYIDLALLSDKLKEDVDAQYIVALTDGVPKSDSKNLPIYINKIRTDRIKSKVASLLQADLKTGVLDWVMMRKYIGEIDRLENTSPGKKGIIPVLTKLSDIKPKPVEWLWWNRFPLGKISLVVGDPGLGKSFLSIYIASRVTTGEPWPEIEMPIPTGSVIILTAEDGLADTVRIRADKAEADVSKIFIIEGITESQDKGVEHFNLQNHLPALEKAIEENEDTCLLIIDPITAYLGNLEGNSNTAVRTALAPLATLAEKYNVAVIAVSHLNKNIAAKAIYRTMGSLAFTAAPRAVWVITQDQQDETKQRRFFVPLKTNLSINPTSLAFRIQDGAVVFEPDPVDITIEEVLSIEDEKHRSAVIDASLWLREVLVDGPISSSRIYDMGKENGFSNATIRRAKSKLNINVIKDGFGERGQWKWALEE